MSTFTVCEKKMFFVVFEKIIPTNKKVIIKKITGGRALQILPYCGHGVLLRKCYNGKGSPIFLINLKLFQL